MSRHRSRSEEHTSELQSRRDLVCRLLLEKKKRNQGGATRGQPPRPPRLASGSAPLRAKNGEARAPPGLPRRRPGHLNPRLFFFLNTRRPPKLFPFSLPDPLRL